MSERLPTVGSRSGPETTPARDAGGGTATAPPEGGPANGGGTRHSEHIPTPLQGGKRPASSVRLVLSLAAAGAIAGFVIVLVHLWSQPRIQAHQARVLNEAVQEVLGAPEEMATLFLMDGEFTAAPAADTADLDRIYAGYDADGTLLGVAVVAAEPGFQDIIRLIFGYDPDTGTVLGMKVLESKETPGLGDKIEKDADFVAEFAGVATPLMGVKSGKSTGAPGEVDMITGATISSQAIVDIINNRLDVLADPLAGLAGTAVAGAVSPAGIAAPGTAPATGTAPAPATSGGTP